MVCSVYVISLADECLRKANIKSQLNDKNKSFSFVNAVDLRSAASEKILDCIKSSEFSSLNRPMTKGETGCALSHLKCYETFLSSDNSSWAWVIEDDANLERLASDTIEKIIPLVNDVDVVILGYSKLSKDDESLFYKFEPIKIVASSDELLLGKPWKNWTCGTVSYLISRAGAKKMLNYFSNGKVSTVADDWLFFEKQVGLKIVHCRPLLVFEDFLNFKSSLEVERATVSRKKTDILDAIRVLRGAFRMIIMKLMR